MKVYTKMIGDRECFDAIVRADIGPDPRLVYAQPKKESIGLSAFDHAFAMHLGKNKKRIVPWQDEKFNPWEIK